MKRDLDLVWQDLVEKAYLTEDNIVLKEVLENTAGAVEILVVESNGKGTVIITQAYCLSTTNVLDEENINRIYLAKFKLEKILSLI